MADGFLLSERGFVEAGFLVGLYVFRPLNEAVGRVREVPELENEEDVLTGENIYDALENRGDEPRDPLLTVSEQNEHAVRDTDRGRAGVEVADDILERVVPTEEVGRDVESGEEPADDNSPDDDAGDDEDGGETGELSDLGEVFLLLVGMLVPVDEADDVDRKPEEEGRRHGREAVGEQNADEYLNDFDEDRDDEVPLGLLRDEQFAEDVEEGVGEVERHYDAALDAVDILLRKYDGADRRQDEDREEPDFLIEREVVPEVARAFCEWFLCGFCVCD